MSNTYLDAMQVFLENSNIENDFPEICGTTQSQDGGITVSDSIHVNMSPNQLRGQELISRTILFIVLDTLLDLWNSEIEEKSFKERCNSLHTATNLDKSIKYTYRIMRIIRNALVHAKNSIQYVEGKTKIEIPNRNGRDIQKITYKQPALSYLNTIILLLLKNRTVKDRYFESILSSYYNLLYSEIIEFNDDISEPFSAIHCDVLIKPKRRYRVEVPSDWESPRNMGYAIKRVEINEIEIGWASDEFLIKREEDFYLIPGETIDDNSYISIEQMDKWKVSPMNSLINK